MSGRLISTGTVRALVDSVPRTSGEDRPSDDVMAGFLESRVRRILAFLAAVVQDARVAEVPVSGDPPDDLAHDVRHALWEDLGCGPDVSTLSRGVHADLLAEVRAEGGLGPAWARVTERGGRLVMTVAPVTAGEHLDASGVETSVG